MQQSGGLAFQENAGFRCRAVIRMAAKRFVYLGDASPYFGCLRRISRFPMATRSQWLGRVTSFEASEKLDAFGESRLFAWF